MAYSLTISLLTAGILLAVSTASVAQVLNWQKTLGGSKDDVATAITATPDGGFVVTGYTNSNDGDIAGNQGGAHDIWVIKLNNAGTIVWKKTFGGTRDDQAVGVALSPDGGYVITGTTTSTDGDLNGLYRYSNGQFTYIFVFKLNSTGDIVWKQAQGLSRGLYATAITALPAGGYVVAGYYFFSGFKSSGNLFYALKLSETGEILSSSSFGGQNGNDELHGITATADGGFVGVGKSSSPYISSSQPPSDHGINHSNNYITYDAWVYKYDNTGQIVWYKFLGGSGHDYANAVKETPDGNLIVAGYTESNDGDVTGNQGGGDAWLLKLNSSGTILSQKTIGGTGNDDAKSIGLTPDGGILVAGTTNSTNGYVIGNHGSQDVWLVKLNASSDLIWQKPLGGFGVDVGTAITVSPTGSFVVAGHTQSNSGDVSGNHGGTDGWVVSLSEPTGTLQLLPPLYNCETGQLTFIASGGNGSTIEFQAPGVTSWTTNPVATIELGVRMDPNSQPITLMARQNGVIVTRTFNFRVYCSGAMSPFQLWEPRYNCATGQLIFQPQGGNGSLIEFQAVGVTPWTTNPIQTVELGVRLDPNSKPLTLRARQNGVVVQRDFDLHGYCNFPMRQATESGEALQVRVLGNPVVGRQLDVEVSASEGQTLQVQLTDLRGQIITEKQIEQTTALEQHRLYLPAGLGGMVLLRVYTNTQQKVVKVLLVP